MNTQLIGSADFQSAVSRPARAWRDNPQTLETSPALPTGSRRYSRLETCATSEKNGSAFTLVELMVAMSLLAVLMTALLMAFQQVQRAFRVGANQSDILEAGRGMMAMVSRDLQEMTYAASPDATNFYSGLPPGGSVLDVDLPFGKTAKLVLEDLFFLKRNNDDWSTIRFAFDPNQLASGVATLYYKTTNTTFADVEGITRSLDATEQITSNNAPVFRRVADGVVHFRVQAFDPQGNLVTPDLVSNAICMAVAPIPNGTNDYSYAYGYTNLPAFVDIEIGLLEPQTLKQLESRLMGVAPADVPKYCQDYLKQKAGKIHLFRQRIPIRTQCRIDT